MAEPSKIATVVQAVGAMLVTLSVFLVEELSTTHDLAPTWLMAMAWVGGWLAKDPLSLAKMLTR